jgi:Ner family transcriptional regulator
MNSWHKEDINAAIRKRCGTLGKFAEMIGVPPYEVRRSVIRAVPRVDIEVAAYIGHAPAELWPHRYGPDGTHVRQLNKLLSEKKEAQSAGGKAILPQREGVSQ